MTTLDFKQYQALAPTFTNYQARIELLQKLVALHHSTPSTLEIVPCAK